MTTAALARIVRHPILRQYVARTRISGVIVTVDCFEDNVLPSGSSVGRGDFVVSGAVRDAQALGAMDIGARALGTNPLKCQKEGTGVTGQPVTFGGATFTPGSHLVSDEDGVVVVAS